MYRVKEHTGYWTAQSKGLLGWSDMSYKSLGRGGSLLTKKFKSAAKARQVVKSLDDEKKG